MDCQLVEGLEPQQTLTNLNMFGVDEALAIP